MDFPQPIEVREIAQWIGADIIGDQSLFATGINEIHKVRPGDITFADNQKYFKTSVHSAATIIILNETTDCPEGKAILIVEQPFIAYDALVTRFRPPSHWERNKSNGVAVDDAAIIEKGAMIGANVKIGARSYIQAGAIVRDHTIIGEDVFIQSGAVIGTDAFYFKKWKNRYQKWATGGRVIIEDNVQIGANATINSGVSGDTVIGEGTKIDCLVMIGHGAVIGKNCLIAAQAGVAGKTIIGDNCIIYAQAGVTQNLNIPGNVTIMAQSGVMDNLESGKSYFGSPASEIKEKMREIVALRKLPALINKLYK